MLACALAVVRARPRSKAEAHLADKSMGMLVEEVMADDLARAAEAA